APSTTVAICVRSPSSARKNATTVTTNTPWPRRGGASIGSAFSGSNAHAATARKDNPINQRCTSGVIQWASHAPASAAMAWLSSDATRMPAQIGHGLRNLAANTSDKSWVLSPISASATAPKEIRNGETRKACKGVSEGPVTHDNPHARSGPDTCTRTVGLADHCDRPRHGLPAEHVDAEPSGSMPDAATPRRSAGSLKAPSLPCNATQPLRAKRLLWKVRPWMAVPVHIAATTADNAAAPSTRRSGMIAYNEMMPERQPNACIPHPLRRLGGLALTLALNRLLALDPDARAAIGKLEGRRIGVHLRGPDIAFAIAARNGTLQIEPPPGAGDDGSANDFEVNATPGALLSMALGRGNGDARPAGK